MVDGLGRGRTLVLLLLGLSLGACRTVAPAVPRYIVTLAPIPLAVGHPGLCVAVDPTDAHGVWWWEPGRSGCSSRTTGPTVFAADRAKVTARNGAATQVEFRVPLMTGPARDYTLVIDGGGLRDAASGEKVPTERRNDLSIPPAHGQ